MKTIDDQSTIYERGINDPDYQERIIRLFESGHEPELLEQYIHVLQTRAATILDQETYGLINQGYDQSLATLKTFGLYDPDNPNPDDILPPSKEETLKIMLRSITSEQLKDIKHMQKPTFLLLPITGFKRYKKALNSMCIPENWESNCGNC